MQAALELARKIDAEELPRLIGDLSEITATCQARLVATPPAKPADELLTVEQTAARLKCSVGYLYKHHKRYPFTRQNAVGSRLLFSASGLDAYLKKARS